jgi:filamentous hemagglutinin
MTLQAGRFTTPKKQGTAFDGVKGKVTWVDENVGLNGAAKDYNDSATGARSNTATRKGQVPAIQMLRGDGIIKVVKFDGLDENTLIDRKTAIVTTPKAINQAIRQSIALRQNGLQGRWEVPDERQRKRAEKFLNGLGITNIKVDIVSKDKK